MHVFDTAVAHAIPLIPRFLIKRISRRYIAGTTLDEALAVVSRLNARGFSATLDILGESAATAAEADLMVGAYHSAITAVADRGLDAEISIKPTALDLLADEGGCEARVRRILDAAKPRAIMACLDMEDARCTQAEVNLFRRVGEEYSGIGLAIQAYLRRSYDDITNIIGYSSRLRICKGIYAEDDIHLVEGAKLDRRSINRHFVAHVARCFSANVFVGVATHDEDLIDTILALARQQGMAPSAFEFQMLLGVCEPLRDRLRNAGYSVRVYVPFGADWYEYSTRRLQENPRIARHILMAIFSR